MKRALLILLLAVIAGSVSVLPSPWSGKAAGTSPLGTRVLVPGGSYRAVTPRRLGGMLQHKDFLLVNVHIPYAGEIAGTDRFIPYTSVGRHLTSLPANKHAMIVLYCRSGRMSDIAARQLVLRGFTNIWHLAGGMDAWRAAGLPLLYRAHA